MIEKRFVMSQQEGITHLSDLLNEIPIQEIEAAVTIMEMATDTLHKS